MRPPISLLLIVTACTSAPPPNPIPVTKPGSAVEVVYPRPTDVRVTTPAGTFLELHGIQLVIGELVEKRGDTSTVSVTLAHDTTVKVIHLPQGTLLRVTQGEGPVIRRPLAGQQVRELAMLALVISLVAAYLHVVCAFCAPGT